MTRVVIILHLRKPIQWGLISTYRTSLFLSLCLFGLPLSSVWYPAPCLRRHHTINNSLKVSSALPQRQEGVRERWRTMGQFSHERFHIGQGPGELILVQIPPCPCNLIYCDLKCTQHSRHFMNTGPVQWPYHTLRSVYISLDWFWTMS